MTRPPSVHSNPSAEEVLPAAFLERLRRIIPAEQWEPVCASFEVPKPTTFRANTLKGEPEALRAELEAAGFIVEPVAWCPSAFILRSRRLADLQETAAYREGRLYVQSLSSLLPVLVLDPQPGEQVLDLAAAPGSKTTQIACLMRGQGRLVANDANRVRFYKLQANVRQQGASNVELSRQYGERIGAAHPGAFNRVLVDAPCGTEGRFYTGRASSYNYWRPRKIHEMVVKQRRLLRAGWDALRPGGVLVYSTCTFAPEENEGVVNWLLREVPEVVIELAALPVGGAAPGLLTWERWVYDARVAQTRRVLPTPEREAFFVAKLRKPEG